jgi:phosphoribosylamine--glycine ligase
MLTPDGPKLLEYNVRFGDPEAQVVLPRLADDLADLLAAAAAGDLGGRSPRFVDAAAVCVVLAAPGYPEDPHSGAVIDGLDAASAVASVEIFHAGVARADEDILVTAGGRVLDVVGFGPGIGEARASAYEAVEQLSWPGIHYRTDIALEAANQ